MRYRLYRMVLTVVMAIVLFCACQPQKTQAVEEVVEEQGAYVKSVLLYDTIRKWPIDTILDALADINLVIAEIETRQAGYSLWRVQSDTIPDYRYLIQGHWPDQASYDSIHVHPDFRKALDDNLHIFTETRKWDLYRRYELIQ